MAVTPAPFTILALARFRPLPADYEPKPTAVDVTTLDEVAAALGPRFSVEVPKDVCPAGELTIAIESIKDFRPENLAAKTGYLKSLREAAAYIDQAVAGGAGADAVAAGIARQWPDLPLDFGPAKAPAAPAPSAADAGTIDDILSMVASGGQAQAGGGSGGSPKLWKDQLDTMTARLLAAVYENPEFRAYEAAWRGLECLAKQAGVKEGGKVRLLICPADEESLPGVLGALASRLALDIPDLTLVDAALDNTPRKVALLESVLEYADLLLAPTACWLTERFFGLDSWAAFSKISYLRHALDDAAFAKWRKLRDHPAAGRLCLMLNRFLARPPYGPDNHPKGVYFQEKEGLWLSPVWALGALCAGSASAFGWATRFTDYASFALRELPMDQTSGGNLATETRLSDDRIHECVEIGLTPLIGPVGKDIAIIPKEAGLDGGSFAFQMFFSRLIATLIALKENTPPDADPATAAASALTALFTASGQMPPDDLDVSPVEDKEGRVALRITLTPPKTILRSQQLTFTFGW